MLVAPVMAAHEGEPGAPPLVLLLRLLMISFANVNKQYGKQVLFVDASFQLNLGEKVGY